MQNQTVVVVGAGLLGSHLFESLCRRNSSAVFITNRNLAIVGANSNTKLFWKAATVIYTAWGVGLPNYKYNLGANLDSLRIFCGNLEFFEREGVKTLVGIGTQVDLAPMLDRLAQFDLDFCRYKTSAYILSKTEAARYLKNSMILKKMWMRLPLVESEFEQPWKIGSIRGNLRRGLKVNIDSPQQLVNVISLCDLSKQVLNYIDTGVSGVFDVSGDGLVQLRDWALAIAHDEGAEASLIQFGTRPPSPVAYPKKGLSDAW